MDGTCHPMSIADRSIAVADEVAAALVAEGAAVAVIGPMALAAHGYIRRTKDVDLGTTTDPFTVLRRVREASRPAVRDLCERFNLGDEWRRIESLLGDAPP